MKAFAASLLIGAAAALEAEAGWEPNNHYDHSDTQHMHYGGPQPASPSYPSVPDLHDAVDAFDVDGTLFGEHRYQLQVAKTGYMLIGTEALRESIAALQDRVAHARVHVFNNDGDIDENDSDIEDNRKQIVENLNRLHELDGRLTDLESGYGQLHHLLSVDREALIMMCHQYAYASTIPDECVPIIGGLAGPIAQQWNWPDADCPGLNALPPFNNPLPVYNKITTDDDDDKPNPEHHYSHHDHDHHHGHDHYDVHDHHDHDAHVHY